LDEHVNRWSILDGFYVPTRYPNSVPDSIPARVYTQSAAREAVKMAEEIVAFVNKHITALERNPITQ
jgi:HEPN domain-containing protein